MPYFNNKDYFTHSNDSRFDDPYRIGGYAELSGIYRCEACGHEIVIDEPRRFPPDSDHECQLQGEHGWRLVAAPKHRENGEFVMK